MNFIFDLDDTLYDQTEPFQRAYRSLWQERYPIEDIEALYRRSRVYNDAIFLRMMAGEVTMEDAGAYRIQKAMEDFHYAVSWDEALCFQDTYSQNLYDLHLSEAIMDMLSYCREHHILTAILSNGVSAHQHKKLDGMHMERWIPKERQFVSGDIGFSKPDQKAFDYVRDQLGLDINETYYVGDSAEPDIRGPLDAGWKCIWYDHRGRQLAEDLHPDYIVHSEAEMGELIKELTKKP